MKTIAKFEHIYKTFFGIHALKDVNMEVYEGEILGLVGENGAGKSTLMNVLAGVHIPEEGRLFLDGKPFAPQKAMDSIDAGVAFIHQELNLFANLSISENFYIGNFPKSKSGMINKRLINQQTVQLLKKVGLDMSPNTQVGKMTQGEKQLVEIAKALAMDARIIIFDEPTTSLTVRETENLFGLIEQLKKEGKTIIYISHILDDIKRLTDRVAVLRDGQMIHIAPTEEMEVLDMIFHMVGRDIENMYPEKTNTITKETLLSVKGLNKKGISKNIDFNVYAGEVLGFFGLMGSGRSEMMNIIFGLDEMEQGEIHIKDKLIKKPSPKTMLENGIAFVTENRREEGLLMEDTIENNLSLVSLEKYQSAPMRLLSKKGILDDCESVSSALSIKCVSVNKSTAKSLSGGNQQKVVIGKWMLSNPDIFVLDEPTRGIDVGAKFEIYSVINDLACKKSGVVVISSEIEELMGICDRIIIMNMGEIVGEVARAEFNKESIIRSAFRQGEAKGAAV